MEKIIENIIQLNRSFFGKNPSVKKINKTKSEINIAKKLKEEYEKELTNIKEKQLTNKSPTIAINVDKLVSLVEQTNDMELQIDEDINKNYTQMVLRRSKKWNI